MSIARRLRSANSAAVGVPARGAGTGAVAVVVGGKWVASLVMLLLLLLLPEVPAVLLSAAIAAVACALVGFGSRTDKLFKLLRACNTRRTKT
jgi:hypothetical protein